MEMADLVEQILGGNGVYMKFSDSSSHYSTRKGWFTNLSRSSSLVHQLDYLA